MVTGLFTIRQKSMVAYEAAVDGINNLTITDYGQIDTEWANAESNYVAPEALPTMADVAAAMDAMPETMDDLADGTTNKAFTATEKTKLSGIESGAINATSVGTLISAAITALVNGAPGQLDTINELAAALGNDANFASTVTAALAGKVDKVTGKQLTTEDFTSALLTKLNGIATGATANSSDATLLARANHTGTQAASTITGLATVATSGSYNDLANKPNIPSVARTTSSMSLSITGSGATGTQVDASKDSTVKLTYSTQITYSLSGSPASQVLLKICATNDSTEANWTTVGSTATRQPTGLSVTIGQVVGSEGQICADVPAGWYVKAVSAGAGTRAEAFVSGQKTIFG